MEEKLYTIIRYVSKKSLASFLEISRTTLYELLKTFEFEKRYQIDRINFLYEEIMNTKGEISSVVLKNGFITISTKIYKKVKSINTDVYFD